MLCRLLIRLRLLPVTDCRAGGRLPQQDFACRSFPTDCIPMQVITGAFSSVSIALSYIADVIHPQNRAPAFGIMMASFSFGEHAQRQLPS